MSRRIAEARELLERAERLLSEAGEPALAGLTSNIRLMAGRAEKATDTRTAFEGPACGECGKAFPSTGWRDAHVARFHEGRSA